MKCGLRHHKYFLNVLVYVSIISLMVLSPIVRSAVAEMADRMADCKRIDNDVDRLKCFDDLTGRKALIKPAAPATTAKDGGKKESSAPATMMEYKWNLGMENRTESQEFKIKPYRPNYLLVAAYNATPNEETSLDVDPKAKGQNTEAKFQFSGKVRPFGYLLGDNKDLWFGYTHLSFWQVYNQAFSSPFRDTNYEPEMFLSFHTNYDFVGLKGRIINVGVNHQSNGRAKPLSRSWDRIVANIGFERVATKVKAERNEFNLFLKAWYRIPESASSDDNPDIDKYLGYGELWGSYYWNHFKFGMMLRNNLRSGDNRGAVQLDGSYQLNKLLGVYIQYFNGYGESLIDYNSSTNRISIGLMLMDWD